MKSILKIALYGVTVSLIMGVLAHFFWQYEMRYALPTPKPIDLKEVCIGDKVDVSPFVQLGSKPLLLHFFNPNCPCSKFNIKEFFKLKHEYGSDIDLAIVLESELEEDVADFKETYGSDMDILLDKGGAISNQLGIYSTPQAVIIKPEGVIYYKGNYNKARFCTNKDSRFVDQALHHVIAGKELPKFTELATISYGCTLPSDERNTMADNSFYASVFRPWSNFTEEIATRSKE